MNEKPPSLKEKYVAEIFIVLAAIRKDHKEGKLSTRDVVEILNKYYDFGGEMIELLKQEVDHEPVN